MNNKKLSKLVKISVLSAIAFILFFVQFPIPILFPGFLKIDLSDIPALLGSFALGPIAGVVIELVKNLLNLVFEGSDSGGVGELANFIVGSAFVFTAGALYRIKKSRKDAFISIIAGILVMTLIASLANYYVLIPMYMKVMTANGVDASKLIPDLSKYVAYTIMPFNLIKGSIVGIITFISYKKLSPILHK